MSRRVKWLTSLRVKAEESRRTIVNYHVPGEDESDIDCEDADIIEGMHILSNLVDYPVVAENVSLVATASDNADEFESQKGKQYLEIGGEELKVVLVHQPRAEDKTEEINSLLQDDEDVIAAKNIEESNLQSSYESHSNPAELGLDIIGHSPQAVVANTTKNNPKRKRKCQETVSSNSRLQNAKKRVKGESYTGFKKEAGKYKQCLEKPKRTMGPRCGGHCKENKKGIAGPNQQFKCAEFTESQRKSVFDYFWQLDSWESKRIFVRENIYVKHPVHRRNSTIAQASRKQISMIFHLSVKDSEEKTYQRVRVCKKFYLATLGLGERSVRNWIASWPENEQVPPDEAIDRKTVSILSDSVAKFFESLPKVESHYCRSSTSKIYLEPLFPSKKAVFDLYASECKNTGNRAASFTLFRDFMRRNKLAIFAPKKDQCNTCTKFKQGTSTEEEYFAHQTKKDLARKEKANDKESALKDSTVKVVTVDLQAVLLAPRLNTAANYYKTKLKVHNQVYFDLATKDVQCYVWHEGQAGLESDVFASITDRYIRDLKSKNPEMTSVIVWSDGCSYQNRNSKVATCLWELAQELKIEIFQKYLTVGHTYMEVDSVHSSIERKLKNRREIFVPAGYLSLIESARSVPAPYKVSYLNHKDFHKFEGSINIRPGYKKGDPVVTDVVAYKFSESDVFFKLSFSSTWELLPKRPIRNNDRVKPLLYEGPIAIEKAKFQHLQELKMYIPEDYRPFYESLHHN